MHREGCALWATPPSSSARNKLFTEDGGGVRPVDRPVQTSETPLSENLEEKRSETARARRESGSPAVAQSGKRESGGQDWCLRLEAFWTKMNFWLLAEGRNVNKQPVELWTKWSRNIGSRSFEFVRKQIEIGGIFHFKTNRTEIKIQNRNISK